MSLKKIIALLIIVNIGYFAYSQGWLQSIAGSENAQREPERLTKQINADAIQVTPAAMPSHATTPSTSDAGAPSTAAAPTQPCTAQREQWIVYMGPYPTVEANRRKKVELKQLGIASTEVSKPRFLNGLSLGQFETENLARDALKRFNAKGVKTATVVLWATKTEPC